MDEPRIQNLNGPNPKPTARGVAFFIVLHGWQLVQATLFGCSPQCANGWRRFLLRCFGARIGNKVIIRPTARFTYPWKIRIDDYSQIGDGAVLYSLAPIHIGRHSVISQKSYLCTGSHDYRDITFPQITAPIHIEDEVWIAADVFIASGVTVGQGAVIGARSSVWKDVPRFVVMAGNPLRHFGERTIIPGVPHGG